MRLHPSAIAIAVGVSAAIFVAGCGSSSAKPSTAAPTTSTSAPSTTTSTSASLSTTSATAATSTIAAAATGNFNSCSTVTRAEAASAIGQAVTPGRLGTATVEGGLACVFYGPSTPTPTNPNVAQPDSVRVVVVKGTDAPKWYNDFKSKVPAQPIAGYGDTAYYDGRASLSVLKGNSYLRIAVSPAGAPPSLAAEKQLATVILPKL